MAFLSAQTIAEYTFSNTADGTLQDMTGSTDLLPAATYYDDTASAVFDIGFTFSFGTGAYSQFSANSNGQMRLGATVINGGSTSPTSGYALLAPLSGDNSVQASGRLHYILTGIAPNRKLVVEWLDLRVPYSSATETGTYGRMQAWLYEGTNNIKFVYGQMYNMATSSSSRGVFISTSNVAGTVGNVTDIVNTMAWNTTSTGEVTTAFPASSFMTNLNSPTEGARRVFSFAYPVYNVPPNPAISPSPADASTGLNIFPTLSWQSGGGGPTSYDVYFNGVLVSPNQAASSYTPGTLAYSTTYTWQVIPRNDYGPAVGCPVWSFTTMADPTVTVFPYTESFDGTTFAPLGWTNVRTAGTGNPGIWDRQTAGTSPTCSPFNGAAMARYNSYSLSGGTIGILVTPPMNVPNGEDFRVKFAMYRDNGYTTYSNEVVNVYVNETPGTTGATLLGTISRYYGFAPVEAVANAWYEYAFSFTGSTADKYVIFEAVSQFGNNMFIDHVVVEEIPALPVLVVNPTSWDFGPQAVNATVTKQFTIANSGGGVLNINSVIVTGTYYTMTVAPTDMSLTAGESTTFTVQYAPTAMGTHIGNVAITDGRMVTNVPLSGSAAQQIIMSTGSTTLAVGEIWNFYDSGAAAGTYQVSENYTYTFYPPAGYRINANFSMFNTESGYDYLRTYDGVNATAPLLGEFNGTLTPFVVTAAGAMTFVFTSDSSVQYDGWVAQISLLALPTGMPEAVTLNTPANAATNMPVAGFDFTWTPAAGGGAPVYYGVYMSMVEANIYSDYYWETTNTHFNPTTAATTPVTFAYDQRWYWTVEAFNGDGSAVVDPPNWFQIQSDTSITIPPTYLTDFESWPPTNWDMTGGSHSYLQYTDATPNNWAMANFWSWSAGSTAYMTTPPLMSATPVKLSFTWSHTYNASYPNDALTVQVWDGSLWHDIWYKAVTDLESNDGAGNTTPGTGALAQLIIPTAYTSGAFQVRFYALSGWGPDLYIDNVQFSQPLAHDVGVQSIIVNQVVTPTPFNPQAIVENFGTNAETFMVSIAIGTWTDSQQVTGLAPGASAPVVFAQYTPIVNTGNDVTVTTILTGDLNAANDTMTSVIYCLDLNKQAYADAAYDPSAVLAGPASFMLQTPGTITDLTAPSPYPSQFLAGADWINGQWWGAEYFDATVPTSGSWWNISTTDGAGTDIGNLGVNLTGVAWDYSNNIVYGTDGTSLYRVSMTGVPTLLGTLTWNGVAFDGLFIGLAWNNMTSTLYGLCIGYDAVFTINPATLAITALGYTTGFDHGYAQDMAIDQTSGQLYLAAYAGSGNLLWVNTTPNIDGFCGEAYVIGGFQGNAEMDGFVIPYPSLETPEVSIGQNGVLSWPAVAAAASYNVYSADDPYGPFTFVANTSSTTWPSSLSFPMKFYRVKSVDGTRTPTIVQDNTSRNRVNVLNRNSRRPQVQPNSGPFTNTK